MPREWLLSSPERNALLRATVTPTVLTGSNKTNVIPQEASAEIDIRLLPDEDTTAFRRDENGGSTSGCSSVKSPSGSAWTRARSPTGS